MGVRARAAAPAGAARIVLAFSILGLALRSQAADEPDAGAPRRLPTARVTAVRPEELPEDPSSFATVIETEDHRGEAETVEGLLDGSVGVQVRRFGGPGQPAEVTIRGSTGQQVVVRLDGVRLNTAQSGTVDLSTLPLAMVERIEVSRGGGSARAGSGAIGGVVDVVTRRPTGRRRSSASFAGGSFGTWQGSLSHSDRSGPVDWQLGYAGFTTDGDWRFQSVELQADGETTDDSRELRRINNDSESHALLVQGAGDLAEGLRLRAWDHAYYVSRGQPGPDDDPSAPHGGQNPRAHQRNARNVAAVTLEADGWEPLPDSVRLQSTLSWLYEQTRYRDPDPGIARPPIETRAKNRSGGWRSAGSWEGRGLGVEHRARAELALRFDSFASNETSLHHRYTEGVSVSDELGFWKGRVELLPTVRLDHTDDFGSEWIPQLGLVVKPWPWLRIKGNAERSYRVPDFDELYLPDNGYVRGNPDLDPERAWNFDVGVELGLSRLWLLENLRLQAAWFDQEIDNSIVFQRINPTTVAPTNTNDARVRGFELAGRFTLFGWVGFSANWTHQDGELDRPQSSDPGGLFPPIQPFSGTAIPGQADDEYQLRLRVGPESGLFRIVGERRYTSKIHLNFSNASSLSSRTVYDLSASLDLARLWRMQSRWLPRSLLASVTVSNLTDQSVRDSFGFPQPGRSLLFGLEGRW